MHLLHRWNGSSITNHRLVEVMAFYMRPPACASRATSEHKVVLNPDTNDITFFGERGLSVPITEGWPGRCVGPSLLSTPRSLSGDLKQKSALVVSHTFPVTAPSSLFQLITTTPLHHEDHQTHQIHHNGLFSPHVCPKDGLHGRSEHQGRSPSSVPEVHSCILW